LQQETESLEHAPEHSHVAGNTNGKERAALLEKENERLKSDLATIPELLDRKNTLEQALGSTNMIAESIEAQSNRIQQAIKRTRRELQEIYTQEKKRQALEKQRKR
jgi:hypothetical protein